MEIPRHWRLKKQRYGLVGEVCPHCDYRMFPPRDVCPNCGRDGAELYVVDELAKGRTLAQITQSLATQHNVG